MDEVPKASGRLCLRVLRRLFGVALLVALLLLIWRGGTDHEAVLAWKERAHPAVFFALMALLPAVGFPTTPLYVLAGATYGAVAGVVGTLAAVSANIVLCYWLARSSLRPVLVRLLKRAGFTVPELEGGAELRFFLVVRMAPGVPSFVKNYLLGLAGISFGLYWGLSTFIAGVYAVSFVLLGESILAHDPWLALGALVLLAAVAFAVFAWRRRQAQAGDGNAE